MEVVEKTEIMLMQVLEFLVTFQIQNWEEKDLSQ